MEPSEIVHQIVSAENNARKLYIEATKQKEDFSAQMAAEISVMREEYFDRAHAAIAVAAQRAKAQADTEIEMLNEQYAKNMEIAKNSYQDKKQKLVDEMFAMVVDSDA